MLIFPAIDLYEKKAVRLLRGEYSRMTVYSDAPWEIGRAFADAGAQWIHTVDLEGARSGGTPNMDTVIRIKEESGLKCEIGGGIRGMDALERYMESGIDRAILSTAAVEDESFLIRALERYGDRIAVSADIRDGYVATRGWLGTTGIAVFDFCRRMQELGVKTLVCTDISKDGAMKGTNLELYRSLSEKFSLNVTASGGVSSLEDVKRLREYGLYGAIIGKAYYVGAIDLKEAIEAAR